MILTGKMIDQATGRPVDGGVRAAALSDNPFAKRHPESVDAIRYPVGTDANGVFRVVTLPGPVLLIAGLSVYEDRIKYKPSLPEPKYRHYFRKEPDYLAYYVPGGGFSPIMGIFFKVLDLKPDAKIVKQNIILERVPAVTVHIHDADGKPLESVYVTGITPQERDWSRCEENTCFAYGIQRGKPRLMLFYHPKRKLAATITLKGDEKQPVVVKLTAPAGTVKGRLLDADGKALAGVRVDPRYHHRGADAMHRRIYDDRQIVTDAQGMFMIEEVIPGFKFELSFRRGKRRFERETKSAEAMIQVKPGECRDLGAIKLILPGS